MVTTTSPCASAKPAWSAAALPKLRRSRTTRTLSCEACRRVSAENVPSVEPSSTKTTSHGSSSCPSAEASSSCRSATLRSSSCTGTITEITPVSVCRLMPPLLSIDEALARVLARVRPLESERLPVGEAAGRVLAEDVTAAGRPAAVPELGDGRLCDQGGGRTGDAADRRSDRGRRARGAAARGRRGDGRSRRAAPCRRAPTRLCRSRLLSNMTTARGAGSGRRWSARPTDRRRCARRRPSARRGNGARRRADRRARRSRDRRGLVQPPAARRRPQHGHRAPRARRARSVRARSTSRTARCSRQRSRPPARAVERIGPVADDEDEHRRRSSAGLEADVLVSSGGVSVGPHDLVRRVLGELGAEEDFWGVAVRPGKPLAFGVAERRWSSGCRATRSRRSSPWSSSSGRRCGRSRVTPSPGPRFERARLASAASTERCAGRARAGAHRATATGPCSSPCAARSRT